MSQDKHYNILDPKIPIGLQDRKGTDMPATRFMVVLIVVLLVAFAVIASIIYARADPANTNSAPVRIELVP